MRNEIKVALQEWAWVVGASALVGITLAGAARAETASTATATAAPAEAAPAAKSPEGARWIERVKVGGMVDVYGAYNWNRPDDGVLEESFIPGTGSTGKRANAFDLNLAALDLSMAPEPVGFNLSLVYGTGTQVVHVAEPRGDGDLDEVSAYDLVYRASVAANVPIGTGLLVEAGIMPSHIGFEGFYSKDNWNYTRAWLGEMSPYYQCGISVGYKVNDNVSVKALVLNGWQNVSENNRAKALGTQVAFTAGALSLSVNTFFGPEQTDNTRDWRSFGDLVVSFAATDWLSLAAQADVGYEERAGADDPIWHGYAGFVRVSPTDWLNVALRGEIFRDPENGISGFRQTLWEVTGTLELRPWEHLSVKLEARYDESDAEVFAGRDTGNALDGERERSQVTVYCGVVIYF